MDLKLVFGLLCIGVAMSSPIPGGHGHHIPPPDHIHTVHHHHTKIIPVPVIKTVLIDGPHHNSHGGDFGGDLQLGGHQELHGGDFHGLQHGHGGDLHDLHQGHGAEHGSAW